MDIRDARKYLEQHYPFLGQPLMHGNNIFEYVNVKESEYNMYYPQLLRDEHISKLTSMHKFDFGHPDFRVPGMVAQKYTIRGYIE